jgi:hypothetical protein
MRLEFGIPGGQAPTGQHALICGAASGGMTLGANQGQIAHVALRSQDRNPHEFSTPRQVGQESHRQPAVLETQSAVSGDVRWCRHMPLCPTRSVVECRRMSPGVVGHWGRYWGRYWGRCWGSRCVRGRSSPCSENPIRGRTHLILTPLRFSLYPETLRPVFEPTSTQCSFAWPHINTRNCCPS